MTWELWGCPGIEELLFSLSYLAPYASVWGHSSTWACGLRAPGADLFCWSLCSCDSLQTRNYWKKNKINKKWCCLTSEKGIWKARSQLHTVTADLLWNQHSWKSRLCVLNRARDPKDPTPPDFPKTPHEFGRTSVPVRTGQGAECLPECSFRPPCQAVSHQQMLGAKGQAPGGLSCSNSMAAAKQCQAISLYRLYYRDWKGSLYV